MDRNVKKRSFPKVRVNYTSGKEEESMEVALKSAGPYDHVDADGNGEIDFEEFCACMKKSQSIVRSTNEELIRECFDIFDQDHNGIITESEFKYVAKEYGDFSEELAEKVFRELDVSANGHLSADQFATVVEDYLLYDTTRIDIDKESE
ncbi:EF hand [Teladorsagia circumcincta]|uniref:EF hand n=1 Tax=Teladorsagia circumcincta TaxID=45464 RepID=A0A2G9URM2_TELCI|nr:EF hand [Teladorsagia circumcincta]